MAKFTEPKQKRIIFRTTEEMKQKLKKIAEQQKNTLTGSLELMIDKEFNKVNFEVVKSTKK